MKVSDIVAEVARTTRRSKRDVEPIVRAVKQAITTGIAVDGEVAIYGLGRFSIRKTRPITLNDRWSGEAVKVPPRDTLRFTPGRDAVRAVARRGGRRVSA